MNKKKLYIWKLAEFLHRHEMRMSGDELATHLNRNSFLTSYRTTYAGGRGTYKLLKETWSWIHNDLGLEDDARFIAEAFVKANGSCPWN
ncbi:hypothetical protein K8T06_12650 [bacterium]|nr:hypothetical protein [bacterium]